MSFSAPWWTIPLAAGLTVPPLVALYFLKLKRNVQIVPSTLLWKRAVEDLHVNAPFQRLRSSLLLALQLLLLLLGAMALGRPMQQTAAVHRDALILLIDRSASMNVVEAGGASRLERAKEEAKKCVTNMADGAQAMVIAFSDRATVVSSFDTDKDAVRRKIDAIEPTQGPTRLKEAVSLAEAYAQTIIIGGEQVGSDVSSDPTTAPGQVFLFTDGRIEDLDQVAVERFDVNRITVNRIGLRGDNVGIVAMDARRHYERPEYLEVVATLAHFGDQAREVDAVLYVDGRNVDVVTVRLPAVPAAESAAGDEAGAGFGVAAFDDIEFTGAGIIQVTLQVHDALPADDRAWTLIDEPAPMRVLLVESGSGVLADYLAAFPVELTRMTAAQYESASDADLLEGRRSRFDVVILDRHPTSKLPPGNYFFWGAAPRIPDISTGAAIQNQIVFNWDESHPVLRYVGVETLQLHQWLDLKLPVDAQSLIDGETSSILAYVARDSSQFLICAFSLIVDGPGGQPVENTLWNYSADFVIFLQNALTFLSSQLAVSGRQSLLPGESITLPVRAGTVQAAVVRPDATEDLLSVSSHDTVHYGRTDAVGTYRLKEGLAGEDTFAVNLFNETESRVQPVKTLSLGTDQIRAQTGSIDVNRPAWPYFLLAILAVLLLEWIVYNKRVFL